MIDAQQPILHLLDIYSDKHRCYLLDDYVPNLVDQVLELGSSKSQVYDVGLRPFLNKNRYFSLPGIAPLPMMPKAEALFVDLSY